MEEIYSIMKKQIIESEEETAQFLQEEASSNLSLINLYKPKSKLIKQEISIFIGGLK
jgi:hypothetical protein